MRRLVAGILIGLGAGWQLFGNRPVAIAEQRLMSDEGQLVTTIRKVSPAVVSILTVSLNEDQFFAPVPQRGAGSGVVISRQGDILTNFHVIGGAGRMEVVFGDDRSRSPARLVGSDPLTDLAIIRAERLPAGLMPATLGTSGDLQVGQQAIAIGNPFGLGRTVTKGVVSAVRDIRHDDGRVMRGMIQTDAAINQGNSGGPLLNSRGEVIGINTMIVSPSGGSVGIGFAVPVDRAKRLIPDLLSRGRVIRPWLGVDPFPLTPELARLLKSPVSKGVLVSRVLPGGSLARAGLKGGTRAVTVAGRQVLIGGDIITAVDGTPVSDTETLRTAIEARRIDETVVVTLVRDGRTLRARVRLVGPP